MAKWQGVFCGDWIECTHRACIAFARLSKRLALSRDDDERARKPLLRLARQRGAILAFCAVLLMPASTPLLPPDISEAFTEELGRAPFRTQSPSGLTESQTSSFPKAESCQRAVSDGERREGPIELVNLPLATPSPDRPRSSRQPGTVRSAKASRDGISALDQLH